VAGPALLVVIVRTERSWLGDHGWQDEQPTDGTIVWTSPTGGSIAPPDGYSCFADAAAAVSRAATTEAQQITQEGSADHPCPRRAARPAPDNAETGRVNRARK